MSRILRELVGAREPAFSLRIRQLEIATGRKTVDISLTSDILLSISKKIKQLGLDPHDTTNEELHAVLIQKAIHDDSLIARSYHNNIDSLVSAINKKAPTSLIPVFKTSALRKLITQAPPKKVMAAYGFRSVASMLKRVDIDQILVASFLLESLTWHRLVAKKLRAMPTTNITMQKPKVVIVGSEILDKIGSHHRSVYVQFAGISGVIPRKLKEASMLVLATESLESLYHLHTRGVLLKLNRFNDDFQKTLVKLTYTAPGNMGAINRVGLSWQSIYLSVYGQKHVVSQLNDDLIELTDFFWRLPGEALTIVHQGLEFWHNTDVLGRPTSYRPISLNISDIALDAYNLLPLSHSTHTSLSRALTAELLSRYVKLDQKHEATLRKIGIIV